MRKFSVISIAAILATVGVGGCSLPQFHSAAKTVEQSTATPAPANTPPQIQTVNQLVHAVADQLPYGNALLALIAAGATLATGLSVSRHAKTKSALAEVAKALPPGEMDKLSINSKRELNRLAS